MGARAYAPASEPIDTRPLIGGRSNPKSICGKILLHSLSRRCGRRIADPTPLRQQATSETRMPSVQFIEAEIGDDNILNLGRTKCSSSRTTILLLCKRDHGSSTRTMVCDEMADPYSPLAVLTGTPRASESDRAARRNRPCGSCTMTVAGGATTTLRVRGRHDDFSLSPVARSYSCSLGESELAL